MYWWRWGDELQRWRQGCVGFYCPHTQEPEESYAHLGATARYIFRLSESGEVWQAAGERSTEPHKTARFGAAGADNLFKRTVYCESKEEEKNHDLNTPIKPKPELSPHATVYLQKCRTAKTSFRLIFFVICPVIYNWMSQGVITAVNICRRGRCIHSCATQAGAERSTCCFLSERLSSRC